MIPLVVQTGQWLNAEEFAKLAEVHVTNARRALAKAAWRGHSLTVRTVECVGGESGERYEVLASSLPPALYDRWMARQAKRPLPEAPSVGLIAPKLTYDPTSGKRTDKALWIYAIIEPLVGLRRHTPERSAAIARALSREYTRPDGKKVRISRSQLYDWLSRYQDGQLEALRPKPHRDIGQRRVLITRAWDKACPLDEGKKQAIAEALAEHVRSLWASGAPSYKVIQRLAERQLLEYSRNAGWNAPNEALRPTCHVSRNFVEQGRGSGLIAIADQDAKRFFDLYLPRIRRSRDNLKPMDMVVGDVHPIDIAIRRQDGSIAYPRAICWQDVATNRLHATLVLLEKDEGIKQVHVASSFAAMC
jgi:hypothetical protein